MLGSIASGLIRYSVPSIWNVMLKNRCLALDLGLDVRVARSAMFFPLVPLDCPRPGARGVSAAGSLRLFQPAPFRPLVVDHQDVQAERRGADAVAGPQELEQPPQ